MVNPEALADLRGGKSMAASPFLASSRKAFCKTRLQSFQVHFFSIFDPAQDSSSSRRSISSPRTPIVLQLSTRVRYARPANTRSIVEHDVVIWLLSWIPTGRGDITGIQHPLQSRRPGLAEKLMCLSMVRLDMGGFPGRKTQVIIAWERESSP